MPCHDRLTKTCKHQEHGAHFSSSLSRFEHSAVVVPERERKRSGILWTHRESLRPSNYPHLAHRGMHHHHHPPCHRPSPYYTSCSSCFWSCWPRTAFPTNQNTLQDALRAPLASQRSWRTPDTDTAALASCGTCGSDAHGDLFDGPACRSRTDSSTPRVRRSGGSQHTRGAPGSAFGDRASIGSRG